MTVAAGNWHVHFRDTSDIAAHICTAHRNYRQLLPSCGDERPDGNCEHVQVYECACPELRLCEICDVDDRE